MYSKYLTIKHSKTGLGVFAKIQIPAKFPILEFSGDIIPRNKLSIDLSQVLQVGPDKFLGPSGAVDDYINHSCEPNCLLHIVGNRVFLYSMYVIPINTELTYDYSMSSTDTLDKWQMNCHCGSYKCRKIISGYQYLDDSLKKEYAAKGMVPIFITNPNFYKKK